jgi:hypothetical protein
LRRSGAVAELESAIELVFQRFTVAAAAVIAYDPDHDPDYSFAVLSPVSSESRSTCRHTAQWEAVGLRGSTN